MAERVCSWIVCIASSACGVSGLDFGTQGCIEHVLRIARADFLRTLCAIKNPQSESGDRKLSVGAVFLCVRPDVQTHAGDGAVCDALAGLLASTKIYDLRFTIYEPQICHVTRHSSLVTVDGENSFLRFERCFVRHHVFRAADGA